MTKELFGTDGIRGIPGSIRWTTPLYTASRERSENIYWNATRNPAR